MADLDALAFATRITHACQASPVVQSNGVTIQDNLLVKIRADLRPDLFVDVFYNAGTSKTSFALLKAFSMIESGVRVYGADNSTIGWHIHPFDNPNSHQTSESVAFDAFLRTVEEWLTRKATP